MCVLSHNFHHYRSYGMAVKISTNIWCITHIISIKFDLIKLNLSRSLRFFISQQLSTLLTKMAIPWPEISIHYTHTLISLMLINWHSIIIQVINIQLKTNLVRTHSEWNHFENVSISKHKQPNTHIQTLHTLYKYTHAWMKSN